MYFAILSLLRFLSERCIANFDGTSYAVYIPILSITSSFTLFAVVYVFVFLCATVVCWSSSFISKVLEAIENLQCEWSVGKAQQKSLQSGLADIQDLRAQFWTQSQWSVVWFRKA